jgi:hypothetical protein
MLNLDRHMRIQLDTLIEEFVERHRAIPRFFYQLLERFFRFGGQIFHRNEDSVAARFDEPDKAVRKGVLGFGVQGRKRPRADNSINVACKKLRTTHSSAGACGGWNNEIRRLAEDESGPIEHSCCAVGSFERNCSAARQCKLRERYAEEAGRRVRHRHGLRMLTGGTKTYRDRVDAFRYTKHVDISSAGRGRFIRGLQQGDCLSGTGIENRA